MLNLQFTQEVVEVLNRQTVYEGFYRLEQLTFRHRLFKGGWSQPLHRELVERAHAVAILLFDPTLYQLVLIQQFRIGAFIGDLTTPASLKAHDSAWLFEIVAGMVEPKEDLEEVARRETFEEAGLTVTGLLPVCEYWSSPASSTEKISVFCGRVDARFAAGIYGLAVEGEDTQVHCVPVQTAYDYLKQGLIKNAPTLIALQWFQLHENWIMDQWKPIQRVKS